MNQPENTPRSIWIHSINRQPVEPGKSVKKIFIAQTQNGPKKHLASLNSLRGALLN